MPSEQNRIDPLARITDERLNRAVSILKEGAKHEGPPARERLVELAQDLDRLLGEIESFRKIVYCQNRNGSVHAAACQLGTAGVLRVLAGSVVAGNQKLPKDRFFNAPSPAARFVLRNSVSGPKAWKDWRGRSIKSMEA